MKECFHFTKNRFLRSILRYGLQPKFGKNCLIIEDEKGEKISYSIGEENAIRMFSALYHAYTRIYSGMVDKKLYNEEGRRGIEEIQSSENFEDWEEPGVYLMFDGDYIADSNKDESKMHDAYTDMSIPPEQIKVCVLKNKRTGKIYSSKYDVVCFWIAKSNNRGITYFNIGYEDKIKKFESEEFEMFYIDLREFCEMYPEKLGEKGPITITQIGRIYAPIENTKHISRIFDNEPSRLEEEVK